MWPATPVPEPARTRRPRYDSRSFERRYDWPSPRPTPTRSASSWAAEGIGPTDDQMAVEVAGALLAGPYPELGVRRIDEVIGFAPNADVAGTTGAALLAPQELRTHDIRTLLAGAAMAFGRDPSK